MKLLQSRVLTVAVDHGELAINTDRSQASRAAGAVWLRQGPAVLFFPGAGNLWQVEVFDTKLYVVERLLCQFRKSRISGITHLPDGKTVRTFQGPCSFRMTRPRRPCRVLAASG
jgi:secreted PhoX family phosphatase